MKFPVDMSPSQVERKVGTKIYEKMMKILRGQTGELRDGKIYFYNYDLQKAYALCTKDEGGSNE